MEIVKEPPVMVAKKETWNLRWDFLKAQEPDGTATDKENRDKILNALADGFEPFAVVPMMVRKSNFGNDVSVTTWIYFKRPSTIVEKVDDSERIIK
jgi:hypothetical protein